MKDRGFTWVLTVYSENGQDTGIQYRFSTQRSAIKQMEREFSNGRSVHLSRQYWESDDTPWWAAEKA